MSTFLALYVLLASAGLYTAHLYSRSKKYPPGPPGNPIFGNSKYPWYKANFNKELSKKLGDVLYYYHPWKNVSILTVNTYRALQDVMVQRGHLYADRPESKMVEILDQKILVSDRYGPTWRVKSKLFLQHMRSTSLQQFWGLIEDETRGSILRLHKDPKDFMEEIRLVVTKFIMGVTYDLQDVESVDDPRVQAVEAATYHTVLSMFPDQFIINGLRWLSYLPSWLPGCGNVKTAQAWKKTDTVAYKQPYDSVKKAIASGTANKSFVLNVFEDKEGQKLAESEITGLAGAMYAAGSSTTINTLHGFLLAMCLNPEVQAKAQAEVDRVIGHERLPTMEDRDKLPYVNSIVNEMLRWWPTAPLGIPHRLMEDDVFNGGFVPKGTVVLANVWAISRDEEQYPDPEVFRPDRFLTPLKDGSLPMDPHNFIFGCGRRACPGRDLADLMIFSYIANILATTNITKALDENGNEITPSSVPGGADVRPRAAPFVCAINPRTDTPVVKFLKA